MDEKIVAERIAVLRTEKGVSAREMSLAIGQNASYINNIENGKALPSLQGIFYICEYLGITPAQFFDIDSANPSRLDDVIKDLKKLNNDQLEIISRLVKEISKK